MKMPATKEHKRELGRLTAGMPPITRCMRRAARLGWLAAAKRYTEHACPIKAGYLRAFWLAGHRHWQQGIGPLPDEKPPLRKLRRR